ncbi:hypothetical protein SAMN05443637_11289 [Pseudonocardia thermophila]|uniref:Uncharacterized protein n=1 Tax=Pseudonocardia thermophila TaxID=1848 RepID=A0A1M6VF35_PSETH|nr:hypothetical protein SAMN05443637_11289 [Pseudonocardia thermophila]
MAVGPPSAILASTSCTVRTSRRGRSRDSLHHVRDSARTRLLGGPDARLAAGATRGAPRRPALSAPRRSIHNLGPGDSAPRARRSSAPSSAARRFTTHPSGRTPTIGPPVGYDGSARPADGSRTVRRPTETVRRIAGERSARRVDQPITERRETRDEWCGCGLSPDGATATPVRSGQHHVSPRGRRFTHIWGQLCGQSRRAPWTDRRDSVDNRCPAGGQLWWIAVHPRLRRSTHGGVRGGVHTPPHRPTCADGLRPHHAQGLVRLLEIFSTAKQRRNRGGEDASGRRCPPACPDDHAAITRSWPK